MEEIADAAIDSYKQCIDAARNQIVGELMRRSAHKTPFVAMIDARTFLEETLNPSDRY